MSEYQYVAFRAIDAQVTETNLKFMRRQSSRADITPWSFVNHYEFGDFHGNAMEMLRRGYDFHLHYANYGIRRLMIRLRSGLPDIKTAESYRENDSLKILKDKQGPGCILCIDPFFEPGDLDEIFELDAFLERLLPLRAEILDGDLRPLYLAHLAVASDGNHDPEKTLDAPVPAGLQDLTDAQQALAEFYGLSEVLIAAAARNSPPLSKRDDPDRTYTSWLECQPDAKKDEWLSRLMTDPRGDVRREILAEHQKEHSPTSWATLLITRTIAELQAMAQEIQKQQDHTHAEEAARKRAKNLAEMAADPKKTLKKTDELVKERSIDAYHKIARLLVDLREALSDTDQSGLADEHALMLKHKNPNLHHLTAALRDRDFLKK